MGEIKTTRAFAKLREFYKIHDCGWVENEDILLGLRRHHLEELADKNPAKKKQIFYLEKRDPSMGRKEQEEIIFLEKLLHIKKYIGLLSLVPFTRMIFLGGSLACGTPKKESDIDLIVVAKHNYVWLNRMFLELLTRTIGKRRVANKTKNCFCFSYSFEDRDPIFKNQDFVSAHFYKHIIPVWGAGNTNLKQFWRANSWILNYAPNFALAKSNLVNLKNKKILETTRTTLELVLAYSGLAYLLERFSGQVQKRYIIKKSKDWSGDKDTVLILEKNCIYYHFPYSPWVRKRDKLKKLP